MKKHKRLIVSLLALILITTCFAPAAYGLTEAGQETDILSPLVIDIDLTDLMASGASSGTLEILPEWGIQMFSSNAIFARAQITWNRVSPTSLNYNIYIAASKMATEIGYDMVLNQYANSSWSHHKTLSYSSTNRASLSVAGNTSLIAGFSYRITLTAWVSDGGRTSATNTTPIIP